MKGPDDGVEASATLTWNESRSGEPADSVIDAFVGHHDDSQGRSPSRSPWRAPIASCISASAGKIGPWRPGLAREPHRRREIWLCAAWRVECFLTRTGAENF